MPESLICAVCGHPVPLDQDHRVVTDEKKRMRDRNEQDDYVVHDRCANAIFDGWKTP
jgi:predicted nucleic acid-binding Zn ribbon protein